MSSGVPETDLLVNDKKFLKGRGKIWVLQSSTHPSMLRFFAFSFIGRLVERRNCTLSTTV